MLNRDLARANLETAIGNLQGLVNSFTARAGGTPGTPGGLGAAAAVGGPAAMLDLQGRSVIDLQGPLADTLGPYIKDTQEAGVLPDGTWRWIVATRKEGANLTGQIQDWLHQQGDAGKATTVTLEPLTELNQLPRDALGTQGDAGLRQTASGAALVDGPMLRGQVLEAMGIAVGGSAGYLDRETVRGAIVKMLVAFEKWERSLKTENAASPHVSPHGKA